MAYKYEKEVTEQNLLAEGEYEVFVEKMEEKITPNGAKKISIQFRIRKDVTQAFGGRILFEDIWKERTTEFYNRKRLNQLLGTQKGLTDGTVFESVGDIIDFMLNANLKIKVSIEYDEYNGEERERNVIQWYSSSSHTSIPSKLEEAAANATPTPKKDTPVDFPTHDVDDLPF